MANLRAFYPVAFPLAMLFACQPKKNAEQSQTADSTQTTMATQKTNMTKAAFGTLPDGTTADIYTLTNASGMTVKITNYGGIVTSVRVPDKDGKPGEVVLGFDSLAPYLDSLYKAECPYFGAIIGRYGNRIAQAKFTLDGKTYTLAANNKANHLHGGKTGFDKVVWQVEPMDGKEPGLKLTYASKDGEEGYPGNLAVTVIYTLTDANELKVSYEATTDKPTPVNLTNHSYFNLSGGLAKDILGHELTMQADQYVAVATDLIPTGQLLPVKNTPMDFTAPHKIGERSEQVFSGKGAPGKGYDHCFVFRRQGGGLELLVRVHEPQSGRVLEVLTTEPGVQFYTGNFLEGNLTGHGGTVYASHSGFCFETQHFPDSPNQPKFPNTILRPGETFRSETVYKFSTQ